MTNPNVKVRGWMTETHNFFSETHKFFLLTLCPWDKHEPKKIFKVDSGLILWLFGFGSLVLGLLVHKGSVSSHLMTPSKITTVLGTGFNIAATILRAF